MLPASVSVSFIVLVYFATSPNQVNGERLKPTSTPLALNQSCGLAAISDRTFSWNPPIPFTRYDLPCQRTEVDRVRECRKCRALRLQFRLEQHFFDSFRTLSRSKIDHEPGLDKTVRGRQD